MYKFDYLPKIKIDSCKPHAFPVTTEHCRGDSKTAFIALVESILL